MKLSSVCSQADHREVWTKAVSNGSDMLDPIKAEPAGRAHRVEHKPVIDFTITGLGLRNPGGLCRLQLHSETRARPYYIAVVEYPVMELAGYAKPSAYWRPSPSSLREIETTMPKAAVVALGSSKSHTSIPK